jgi:hypothetical protein
VSGRRAIYVRPSCSWSGRFGSRRKAPRIQLDSADPTSNKHRADTTREEFFSGAGDREIREFVAFEDEWKPESGTGKPRARIPQSSFDSI